MPYTPSDIYRVIEPFFITQGFGENPANYKRFGLAGHNGWDYRTKVIEDIILTNGKKVLATPTGKRGLIAPWFLELYKIGFDPNGFGNYFEVIVKLYSTWKITYAHCSAIHEWKQRFEGTEMAISGSTGNSTGDHVHETVKRIKIINGTHQVQNYNNGYFGAVNNQEFYDELRKWKKEYKDIPALVPTEGVNMDEYKGYDLENKASMRIAVDSHVRVVSREVLPIEEVNAKLDDLSKQLVDERNRAVEQAYKEGIAIGSSQVEVPVTTSPQVPLTNISGWERNGITIETTKDNTKIIENYKKVE